MREHKFIIFGFEHYNTLGAIRSLGEKGISPIVILHKTIKVKPSLVPNSRYASIIHIVDNVEEGYRTLQELYGNEELKPFLCSCDDYVEMCLDSHYEELKDHFYFFNGGQAGIISHYMDKDAISQLAVECGCNIPKTEVVKCGQIPTSLKYPVLTKAKVSAIGGWKKDVHICYSEEELIEAYKTIETEDLLVEEFIEKKNELCIDGISINNGNDVFIPYQASYYRVKPGKYGNYMEFTRFNNEEVYDQVKKILKRAKYNGVFCVEYLIGTDGKLYFLEVNFRNSGWSYAFTYGGVNLLYEWAIATKRGKIDIQEITKQMRNKPFSAMAEVADFRDYVLTGDVSFFSWLKDFATVDVHYWWNKRDMKPIVMYFGTHILSRLSSFINK